MGWNKSVGGADLGVSLKMLRFVGKLKNASPVVLESEPEPTLNKADGSLSLNAGMAALRFASKSKRKIAARAAARRKDGHNKRDTVSLDKQVALVQEQLGQLHQNADMHCIFTVLSAARYLAQKHPGETNIDARAEQVEQQLRSSNPELATKMDLRDAPAIRSQIRRLWDLLLVESFFTNSDREVTLDAYCKFHCCISKAISTEADEWSLADSISAAKEDWADDVARFSSDATINTWLMRIKTVLRQRSQEAVMKNGWKALFKLIDADGSGSLDCQELTDTLRQSGITADTISDLDLRRTFQSVDKDGSGEIDGEEFAMWLIGLEQEKNLAEERNQQLPRATQVLMTCMSAIVDASAARVTSLGWDELFARFDTDGSGGLDSEEFCAAVRAECAVSSEEVADSDLQEVFSMIDDDNSGILSADEFAKALRKDENENYKMTFDAFLASMFELVDYWSHAVSERDYVDFFRAVFRKISVCMTGVVGYDEPVLKSTETRSSADGEQTCDYNYRLKTATDVVASVDDSGKFDLGDLPSPPPPKPTRSALKLKPPSKMQSSPKRTLRPEQARESGPDDATAPVSVSPVSPTQTSRWEQIDTASTTASPAPQSAETRQRASPPRMKAVPAPSPRGRRLKTSEDRNSLREIYPTHHVVAPETAPAIVSPTRNFVTVDNITTPDHKLRRDVPDHKLRRDVPGHKLRRDVPPPVTPHLSCLAYGTCPRLKPIFSPARAPERLQSLTTVDALICETNERALNSTPATASSAPLMDSSRDCEGSAPRTISSRLTRWVALPGVDVTVPIEVEEACSEPCSPPKSPRSEANALIDPWLGSALKSPDSPDSPESPTRFRARMSNPLLGSGSAAFASWSPRSSSGVLPAHQLAAGSTTIKRHGSSSTHMQHLLRNSTLSPRHQKFLPTHRVATNTYEKGTVGPIRVRNGWKPMVPRSAASAASRFMSTQ